MFGARQTVGSEYGIDFITPCGPVCRGAIARIANELCAVHNFEQLIPDALRETPAHHKDIVIGSTGVAWEEAAEIAITPTNANARQWLASVVMLAETYAHEVHHRLLHGEFDTLSLTRFETLDVGRENANGCVQARARIACIGRWFERWPIGQTGEAIGASHGLGNHIETFVFAVGARGAKAFNAGVDNAWVNLLDNVIAQAEVFNRPGGIIFHDDVR